MSNFPKTWIARFGPSPFLLQQRLQKFTVQQFEPAKQTFWGFVIWYFAHDSLLPIRRDASILQNRSYDDIRDLPETEFRLRDDRITHLVEHPVPIEPPAQLPPPPPQPLKLTKKVSPLLIPLKKSS
jgi:hypothetical protein